MDLLFYIYTFFIGTIIGSFLTVIIDRLPRGESIIEGRSHCDHCRRTLNALDLVPVFSYVFLGGKCRYCKKRLSLYYPIIELITGAAFVLVGYILVGMHTNLFLEDIRYVVAAVYFLLLVSSLILIFFIDLRYGLIPFTIVLFALFVTFLWYAFSLPSGYLNPFLSGLGAFTFFLILFFATKRRGMGFGDVMYAFLMGFVLGFPKIILGLYIAFLSGAIISVGLLLLKRKKLHGGTVPFGPFLVLGTFICLFWGQPLLDFLMGFLLK
jgi:prepilin signal peptidase PulO-like enzyme (type II secretory pathway)